MPKFYNFMDAVDQFRGKEGCEELPKRLMKLGLIPREGTYKCPACGNNLRLIKFSDRIDGFRWVCVAKVSKRKQRAKPCNTRVEFRKGTFFEKSHLPIYQLIGFCTFWCWGTTLELIGVQVELSSSALIKWSSVCREVVFCWFFTCPEKLGGPGVEVEIHESKFRNRKYHCGHRVGGQWVFGGYERGSGRIFMVLVESHDAGTVVPVLKNWIHPGTTVISNYWQAHNCLENEQFIDLKVNHSITFKDPDTGIHANSIESMLWAANVSSSTPSRVKHRIPGNLARYMFVKRCQDLKLDPTIEFLRMAGQLYDPMKPPEEVFAQDDTDDTDDDFPLAGHNIFEDEN